MSDTVVAQVSKIISQAQEALKEFNSPTAGADILTAMHSDYFKENLADGLKTGPDYLIDETIWIGVKTDSANYDFGLSFNPEESIFLIEVYPVTQSGRTITFDTLLLVKTPADPQYLSEYTHHSLNSPV